MILVILENHNSTWVFNSLFLSSNFRQNRSMKEDLRKLEFKAQLAHDGSVTKKISDFSNVKELYQRLAEVFEIKRNEVLSKIYILHILIAKSLFTERRGLFISKTLQNIPKFWITKTQKPMYVV